MKYQIDLNKFCDSIESDRSLEASFYIEEHVRSIELKMTRDEFESQKDKLKEALGKLYDALNESLKKSVPEITDKIVSKAKEKKMTVSKDEARKKLDKAFIFVSKNKFIEDMINFISIKDTKVFKKEINKTKKQKGVAILRLENSVFASIFGSVGERDRKFGWITFFSNLIIQILNIFLVKNEKMQQFISDLSYYGHRIADALHYNNLQQVKATNKLRKESGKTYRKTSKDEFEYKKYFKIMWDFDQVFQMQKTVKFREGFGDTNLIVVPKFKIKTINKKDEKNELISN